MLYVIEEIGPMLTVTDNTFHLFIDYAGSFFFFSFFLILVWFFVAARAFSSYGEQGLLFVGVHGFLLK